MYLTKFTQSTIMKLNIIALSLLLLSFSVNAQQPEGTFTNGEDSIVFNNNNVKFKITGFAGLSSAQVGEGQYEIIDDFMLIHTGDYSGNKSVYEELDGSKSDTCVVNVISYSGYPLPGILVESKNKSGKTTGAQVSGNNGKILLINLDKTVGISASGMGYNPISFNYTPGKDYQVKIAENDIIENRTIVLRYNKIDDESVTFLLLSDDFDSSKNIEKGLAKIEKRARRSNVLPKLYTRENAPFRR